MQIPRADAYPDFPPVEGESTTITPTTTGTWRGELQRLSAPSRTDLSHLSDADVRNALDAALTFSGADITMNMGQLGLSQDEALRRLGKSEYGGMRSALRYVMRAANRAPEFGPQDVPTRATAIKEAAGVPGYVERLKGRAHDLADDETWDSINKQLEHHENPPRPTLKNWLTNPTKALDARLRQPKIKVEELPPGATPERLRTPEGKDWLFRFSGKLGPARKDAMLGDFHTRRRLAKLGWTDLDELKGLPLHRIEHILNHSIENTGQAWKYRAIEEGRQAADEVTKNLDRRRRALEEHLSFVDYLRQHGSQVEPYSYPLDPAEGLDPTEQSAQAALQRLREQRWSDPKNPWPPK